MELAARLLKYGILSPSELAAKFVAERSNLDATDTFEYMKDGKRSKRDTYANHIRFLFSLFSLSQKEKAIMRYMTLMPAEGINIRVFASWINETENLNAINDLILKGFIRDNEFRTISLYPILRETTSATEKPSLTNCHTLIEEVYRICLERGRDEPHYRELFVVIENIVSHVTKDDPFYLQFVEDAIPFMQTYNYLPGFELLYSEMERILKSHFPYKKEDVFLLKQYNLQLRSMRKLDPPKTIRDYGELLTQMKPVTVMNAGSISNVLCNLSLLYKDCGKMDLAKESLSEALHIRVDYGLLNSNDGLMQMKNYVILLVQMQKLEEARLCLNDIEAIVKDQVTTTSSEYANCLGLRSFVSLAMGDYKSANNYHNSVLDIYAKVFGKSSSRYQEKAEELSNMMSSVHPYPPHIHQSK